MLPEHRIKAVVNAVPRGKVFSYSRVALLAGMPGGARRVGRALSGMKGVPWWRVLRADLTMAKEVASKQARHLRAEGVLVKGLRVAKDAMATLTEVEERLGR
jgi:methylated-DNA-protein-cysteine methyltransferase-like protein